MSKKGKKMSTKDEVKMRADEVGALMGDIVSKLFGGTEVDVEVVKVPEGKTIEEVMAERGWKPDGDACEGCGLHHEFINAEGTKGLAFPEGEDDKPVPKEASTFAERKAKALSSVREKQAHALKMYDLLKDMERSIAASEQKRDMGTTLAEIVMMLEIKTLARGF